jgi:hypothetical protein
MKTQQKYTHKISFLLTMDQDFKDIINTKHQQRYNLKHSNNEEDGKLEELKSQHLTLQLYVLF